ncbi:MFS transporter [Leuconostoc gelidum]|nr:MULTISPECIES: MFS transporter [Leuconostoc gelidum group]
MTNITINNISHDLHTTLNSVQWIIAAYVLSTSSAIPFSGWLTQHFNGKYVFFVAQMMFGLSFIGAS